MDERLIRLAEATKGFMQPAEAEALHRAALASAGLGPIVEIGTYCGKSTIYLAAAAREIGTVVFTIDHHRGSEEHQLGEQYHDPDLVDGDGQIDSLPAFRQTLTQAQLDSSVVAIVGRSEVVAGFWRTPIGMLFLDGSHSREAAFADYDGWSSALVRGGLLAIHDVFPDPAAGGRPPYEVYRRALSSEAYVEADAAGSLRILRRIR